MSNNIVGFPEVVRAYGTYRPQTARTVFYTHEPQAMSQAGPEQIDTAFEAVHSVLSEQLESFEVISAIQAELEYGWAGLTGLRRFAASQLAPKASGASEQRSLIRDAARLDIGRHLAAVMLPDELSYACDIRDVLATVEQPAKLPDRLASIAGKLREASEQPAAANALYYRSQMQLEALGFSEPFIAAIALAELKPDWVIGQTGDTMLLSRTARMLADSRAIAVHTHMLAGSLDLQRSA